MSAIFSIKRGAFCRLASLALMLLFGVAGWMMVENTSCPRAASAVSDKHEFVGNKSCNSGTCHGGEKQGNQAKWFKDDKHSKAINNLYEDKAYAIGKALGIAEPAEDKQCRTCHTTGGHLENARFGKDFVADDGVGCEACHGGGADYLEIHAKEGKRKEANDKGQLDVWNLTVQAQNCLSCHGAIDSKMIAAGHPVDLGFDLRARRGKMKHWKAGPDANREKLAYAVGAAARLITLIEMHGAASDADKARVEAAIKTTASKVDEWTPDDALKSLTDNGKPAASSLDAAKMALAKIGAWDEKTAGEKVKD